MKNDLFDILDDCITLMDQGFDLESCLARYPKYASELRPLLLAAMDAESLTDDSISPEMLRRSKSRVLNVAAEMREQKSAKRMPIILPWKRALRLTFAALITLLVVVGVGGTGLVQASTQSLPGDQFYPVKLTWESILLKLALSQADREELQDRFERERVEEIEGLLIGNRSEDVEFLGQVVGIFPDQIIVSGITVMVTPETRVKGTIQMDAWARVEGRTISQGMVEAFEIKILDKDSQGNLDDSDSSSGSGNDDSKEDDDNRQDDSLQSTSSREGEKSRTPESEKTEQTESGESDSNKGSSTPKPSSFEIEGLVSGFNGSSLSVGNKVIFIVPETEMRGSLSVDSKVFVRGFVNSDGKLIALRVEVKSGSGSGGDGNSGSGSGGQGGGSGDDDEDPTKTPEPDETPDD